MTYPDSQPGRHAASATLSAARAVRSPAGPSPRFPRQRRVLSQHRAAEVAEQFAKGEFCMYCLGIHAGLSLPGCPRIATFEVDGDGKLRAATYWPDLEWDSSGVYFTSDVETDDLDEHSR